MIEDDGPATGRPRVWIAQPPRQGRVSGGYRFNQDLAESHPDIRLHEVSPQGLGDWFAQAPHGARLWLDSLYLRDPHVRQSDWPALAARGDLERCGLIVHGLTPALREWLPHFDALLCPSAWLRDVVRAWLVSRRLTRRRRARLILLYAGWDGRLSWVEERAGSNGQEAASGRVREILTVANWSNTKGFLEMAASLRLMHGRRPDIPWHWTVAGERDERLVARVRRVLGPAAARLHAPGVLKDQPLRRAYLRSSVFLLLSHEETYSLATQEAGLHGLPMVISGVGGMPEAASRGQALARHLWRKRSGTGAQIVGTDPRVAADALERLLDRTPSGPRARSGVLASRTAHARLRDMSWAGRAARLVCMRSDRVAARLLPSRAPAGSQSDGSSMKLSSQSWMLSFGITSGR